MSCNAEKERIPTMTKIYLVRHAEAEGNLYRVVHGQYNSIITPRGYRQLACLRQRFLESPLDAVYCSDLFRTTVTATALSVPKGLALRPLPLLREVAVGAWEGRTWAELAREEPEMNYNFNKAPDLWHVEGSETFDVVRDRMLSAIRQIAAENPGKTVAAASHGAALRTLLGTLQGLSLREIGQTGHCDNTAVSLLEAEGDEIRVVFRDDAGHLPPELSTFAGQSWHKSDKATEPGLWFRREGETAEALSLTAMLEDEPAGAVAFHLEPDCLRIDRYELVPALRGRRYGIHPMGQAVQYARAHGRGFVRVAPPPESAGFFEKYGFARRSGGELELDIRLIIRDIPPLPADPA